ncbi:hypothetical protein [Catenulispora rubra]|uniref:hypothetical protein n=1 Tax=Catenulispora rubra TaxID=280293 RepID=UPI0018924293|nr:hypothetical protein [Catenulispora rubra]
MTTWGTHFPLDPDRLSPWLTAYGFTRHLVNDYSGVFGRGPAVVHIARPSHVVAVTETADINDQAGQVHTELSAYASDARRIALLGGLVEQGHAQIFRGSFGGNTPPAVIHAAAVAALILRPRPTVTR